MLNFFVTHETIQICSLSLLLKFRQYLEHRPDFEYEKATALAALVISFCSWSLSLRLASLPEPLL